MPSNVVNGDSPHSATIRHLLAYPTVQDGVRTYKSTALGQKSLDIGNAAYQGLANNIFPFLRKPYEYISPYVERVDAVGDQTLSRIEEKFPIVKKPASEIIDDTKKVIFLPLQISQSGREYVFSVYQAEANKLHGNPLVVHSKAAIVTAITLTTESLIFAKDLMTNAKEHTKKSANSGAH
ncbi:hypothetical protein QBC42DRAFT_88784 [Cladorrhinum samala]|uniref:Perilipin MPL1-like protein n=1 Tax=Cladorrhinum samala TaxID=585594 RepID=A0AAV9HM31_9PEZI|nr:hypothetical protein QBC42DRAFT_88784 [Cladorrhinum samala]